MDLIHLCLIGVAGVGQQYGAVGLVTNPRVQLAGFLLAKESTLPSRYETQS